MTAPQSSAVQNPNAISASITGRSYLSFSQISTYQQCSLKWHFRYVAEAKPEVTPAALLLGAGVHAAIQKHWEAIIAADGPPSGEEMLAAYRRVWAENAVDLPVKYSKDEDADSLAVTARQIIDAYRSSEHAKPFGHIIGIEEVLRVRLAADLPDLLAKVDLIEQCGDELLITDYKTARSLWHPDTAENNAEQLLLYGLAASGMARDLSARLRLRFVVVSKAKSPKIEAYEISPDAGRAAKTIAIMRRVWKSMMAGNIFPSPSPMNCGGCPYQKRCKAWAG